VTYGGEAFFADPPCLSVDVCRVGQLAPVLRLHRRQESRLDSHMYAKQRFSRLVAGPNPRG
jgi:hypothetical protein